MSSIPPPSSSGFNTPYCGPFNQRKRRLSDSSELSEKLGDLSIKRKKVTIFSNKKEACLENVKKLPGNVQTKIFKYLVSKLPTGDANMLTAHLINGKIFRPLAALKEVLGKSTAKAHDGNNGGFLHVFLKNPDKEKILENVKSKDDRELEPKTLSQERAKNSFKRRKALYDHLAAMLHADLAPFRKIRAINTKSTESNPSLSRNEIDKKRKEELHAANRSVYKTLVYILTKKGFVRELELIKPLINTFYKNEKASLRTKIPDLQRLSKDSGIANWEKEGVENKIQENYKLLKDLQTMPGTPEDIECLNFKIPEAENAKQLVEQLGRKYRTHQGKLDAFLRKMEQDPQQNPMTAGLLAAWEQAGLKVHDPLIAYTAVKHLRKDVLKGLADLGVNLSSIRIPDEGPLAEREKSRGVVEDELAYGKTVGGTLLHVLLSRGSGESEPQRRKRIDILKMLLQDGKLNVFEKNQWGDYPTLTAMLLDDSEIQEMLEKEMEKQEETLKRVSEKWHPGNTLSLSEGLKKKLPWKAIKKLSFDSIEKLTGSDSITFHKGAWVSSTDLKNELTTNQLLFDLVQDTADLPVHALVNEEDIICNRAKTLLQAGADVNYKNPDADNATPLHNAVRYLNSDLVKLLLKYGATTSPITGKTKQTVLHQVGAKFLMSQYGYDTNEIYKALLNNGADPNIQDSEGNTAAHTLIDNYQDGRNPDTVLFDSLELLKQYGANFHIKNKQNITPYELLKSKNLLRQEELNYLNLTGAQNHNHMSLESNGSSFMDIDPF